MNAELIILIILGVLTTIGLWKIEHYHICYNCGNNAELVDVEYVGNKTIYKYKCPTCGRMFSVEK